MTSNKQPVVPLTFNIDEQPLRFGRYKGEAPNEVAKHNPSYVVWLYENVRPRPVSEELYETARCTQAVAMWDDAWTDDWSDVYDYMLRDD